MRGDALTPSPVFGPEDLQGDCSATLDNTVGAVYGARTALVAFIYGHLGGMESGSQKTSFGSVGMIGVGFLARLVYIHFIDTISNGVIVFIARVLIV